MFLDRFRRALFNHLRMKGALLFLYLVAAVSAAAYEKKPAESPLDLATAISQLNNRYREIENYRADFRQRFLSSVYKNKVPVWSGEVFFRRNKGFLWKYSEPEKKDIGSDGRLLWFIEWKEKRVIVKNLSDDLAFKAGLAFLWGEGKIESFLKCTSVTLAEGEPEATLQCSPKGEKKYFRKVELTFHTEKLVITKSTITDYLGDSNELIFTNPKLNSDVAEPFQLKIPKGFRVAQGAELIKP